MIFVDVFEPYNIEDIIKQSVPTVRDSFNRKGFPDYTWIDGFNRRIGVSRKKLGELLSSLDDAEEQLGRDVDMVDELNLLIEDCFYNETLTERNRPGIQTWIPTKDGRFIRKYKVFSMPISKLDVWLYRISQAGITVIKTFDYTHTSSMLVALYNNTQETEHTTMNRYIRPKVAHREWNHHVLTLMGVHGEINGRSRTFIGEKKAKSLINMFGTVWEVFNKEPSELARAQNMGIVDATKLLRSIGKIKGGLKNE